MVTSEDCAAPPPHVPDPPSTPTVCTTPASVGDIPASSPAPLGPPSLPELEPAPELDEPPEVDPLLEPDEPLEPEELPEIVPLELDMLPESEPPTSPCGELPVVESLPHAPAVTTRHTRHPVIAERGRTPVEIASMLTPSLSRSGVNRRSVETRTWVCSRDLAATNGSVPAGTMESVIRTRWMEVARWMTEPRSKAHCMTGMTGLPSRRPVRPY